jgi:hypothetical protein
MGSVKPAGRMIRQADDTQASSKAASSMRMAKIRLCSDPGESQVWSMNWNRPLAEDELDVALRLRLDSRISVPSR